PAGLYEALAIVCLAPLYFNRLPQHGSREVHPAQRATGLEHRRGIVGQRGDGEFPLQTMGFSEPPDHQMARLPRHRQTATPALVRSALMVSVGVAPLASQALA